LPGDATPHDLEADQATHARCLLASLDRLGADEAPALALHEASETGF